MQVEQHTAAEDYTVRTDFRRFATSSQQACAHDDEALCRRFNAQAVVVYHKLATPLADVGCQVACLP
jgi:hypothetical protein